jgi:hypothetical protein
MSEPRIHVWHGDRQRFGIPGLAQRCVNLLGHIEHADLAAVTLTYTLNKSEPQPLSIGPDSRRLESVGDFNIDIDAASLSVGANEFELIVRHESGEMAHKTVQIDFAPQQWPLPYAVRWRDVTSPQDVVQVIDGVWSHDATGIHNIKPGYDRILGIGDASWGNYEITVPITLHHADPQGFANPNSTAPGLGIVTRWNGHTDMPVQCGQPLCGYLPSGAQSWYDWGDAGGTLFLFGSQPGFLARDTSGLKLADGETTIWKHRVTEQTGGTLHQLKVWRADESEPAAWTLSALDPSQPPVNPATGSVLLLAHHVDVTFGDIVVIG